MKKIFSKWLVGVFAFALCMCLTSTIVKAANVTVSAQRVSDDKTFTISIGYGSGESYGAPIFTPSIASAKILTQQNSGKMTVYTVTLDDIDDFYNLEITLPGKDGSPDIKKYVQVYPHEATDRDLEEEWGDSERGGGKSSDEGNPNYNGGAGGSGGGGGSGVYGDPEDLANVLSDKGGVGEVVFDFLKLIAVILTFGALCFLGVNLMINRDKPEDRVNTMQGFKYIIIGILLLDIVLLIYALVDELMDNQEDEVAEFAAKAPIVEEWIEM